MCVIHGSRKRFQHCDFTLVQSYPRTRQCRTQAPSGQGKERKSLVHTKLYMHVITPTFQESNIFGRFPFTCMSVYHDITRSSLLSYTEPSLLTFNVYICKYCSTRPRRTYEAADWAPRTIAANLTQRTVAANQTRITVVADLHVQRNMHIHMQQHIPLLTVNVHHHEYTHLMLVQFIPANFSPRFNCWR